MPCISIIKRNNSSHCDLCYNVTADTEQIKSTVIMMRDCVYMLPTEPDGQFPDSHVKPFLDMSSGGCLHNGLRTFSRVFLSHTNNSARDSPLRRVNSITHLQSVQVRGGAADRGRTSEFRCGNHLSPWHWHRLLSSKALFCVLVTSMFVAFAFSWDIWSSFLFRLLQVTNVVNTARSLKVNPQGESSRWILTMNPQDDLIRHYPKFRTRRLAEKLQRTSGASHSNTCVRAPLKNFRRFMTESSFSFITSN